MLVVYLPDCHESLAGIIAGRIREKYFKPTFVLTDAEDGVKGSGRSIPGYHMFDEMTKVRDLFTKFGGHPMAAGLSLPPENVEPLRRALNENCRLTEEELTPGLSYDAVLPLCYAGEQIIRELTLLEPSERPMRSRFRGGAPARQERPHHWKKPECAEGRAGGAGGDPSGGCQLRDVKEDLAYIEGRDEVCILYYPEINEYMAAEACSWW